MAFPFQFSPNELDDRGLFLCQDPALCSKTLPLFSFDPRHLERRPSGHGTAFRIDPWSNCATAFHVLEDLFDPNYSSGRLTLHNHIRLAALEIRGTILGKIPMPENAWCPLTEFFSICTIETPPLEAPRIRNTTEIMALRIHPSQLEESDTPYFPIALRNWRPKIGEQVMAFGFADLDVHQVQTDENRPIEQYLYGSLAEIIDIEPTTPQNFRPWPRISVDADWPSGMSGGPVFNEEGMVIGIVSTGIGGSMKTGSATYFSGWDMPAQIFRTIDLNNPGHFRCFGLFDQIGNLITYKEDQSEIERIAADRIFSDITPISVCPETEGFIRIEASGSVRANRVEPGRGGP